MFSMLFSGSPVRGNHSKDISCNPRPNKGDMVVCNSMWCATGGTSTMEVRTLLTEAQLKNQPYPFGLDPNPHLSHMVDLFNKLVSPSELLTALATTLLPVNGVVMSLPCHNHLRNVIVEFCHRAHLGVRVESGSGITPDLSRTRPADVLVLNWERGKHAALNITVTSPLIPSILTAASLSEGAAAEESEVRKHRANDPKCSELGWVCIPLAVETYGNWGREAQSTFSRLATHLAIITSSHKSKVLTELYSRLNFTLVLFLLSLFGWLILLIFWKWVSYYPDATKAPNLFITLIYMFLKLTSASPDGVTEFSVFGTFASMANIQSNTQKVLVGVMVLCVPWMLFMKPIYIIIQQNMNRRRQATYVSIRAEECDDIGAINRDASEEERDNDAANEKAWPACVVTRHNQLCNVLVEFCHHAHLERNRYPETGCNGAPSLSIKTDFHVNFTETFSDGIRVFMNDHLICNHTVELGPKSSYRCRTLKSQTYLISVFAVALDFKLSLPRFLQLSLLLFLQLSPLMFLQLSLLMFLQLSLLMFLQLSLLLFIQLSPLMFLQLSLLMFLQLSLLLFIHANVPAAVPATAPTAVPATVPTAVPATVHTAVLLMFQLMSLLLFQLMSHHVMLIMVAGITYSNAKDRKVARVKEDLTEDGFRRVLESADNPMYATFECKVDWAQTRKAMLPEFSSKVRTFIAHCWQEGIAGRAKVSANAVVVRLTEEYLAGNIRLAELPVVGQVRTSYQSIGQSKDEAPKSPRKKAGCNKPQRKKQKTSNTTSDWSKPLLKWSKPQLQTYLAEHNLRTSGKKPELIERIQACMNTNPK
eukprot:Em0007g1543a